MKNVPNVSVIVPVYNEEKYISIVLADLKRQTIFNIEVICIDDGSTDQTPLIIEKTCKEDSRFRLIKTNHVGAGGARNLGMSEASGEYVVFLDGDDSFEPTMLEKSYEMCKKMKLDICIWDVVELDNGSQKKIMDTPHFRMELFPPKTVFSGRESKFVFNMTSGAPWNKMYSREFLINGKISFMQQKTFNDIYMTYRAILVAERISVINEKLITYRIGNTSSLQGDRDKTIGDAFCAFEKITNLVCCENAYSHIRSWKNYLVSCLYALFVSAKKDTTKEAISNYTLSCNLLSNIVEKDIYDFNRAVWLTLNREMAIYYKREYENLRMIRGYFCDSELQTVQVAQQHS